MSDSLKILPCLMGTQRAVAQQTQCSTALVHRLIEGGLGPIAWGAVKQGRMVVSDDDARVLEASDLTARVISDQSQAALSELLKALNALDIKPALLKGISMAGRYPLRHFRVMSDIDLMIDPRQLTKAIDAMKASGYVNESNMPSMHWDNHHHAEPLYHPTSRLCIELHHGLDSSRWFGSSRLSVSLSQCESVLDSEFGADVFRLPVKLELNYIAMHWYLHLLENLGTHGLQRPLFDACILLQDEYFDQSWVCRDPRVAFATLTLVSVLSNLGVLEFDDQDCRALLGDLGIEKVALDSAVSLATRTVGALRTPISGTLQRVGESWFDHALCYRGKFHRTAFERCRFSGHRLGRTAACLGHAVSFHSRNLLCKRHQTFT